MQFNSDSPQVSPQQPSLARALLFLLLAHFLALACLGFLLVHKHRSLLVELAISRAEITVSATQSAMATATLSGLEVSEMRQMQMQLAALPGPATGIAAASMFSLTQTPGAKDRSSQIDFSTAAGRQGQAIDDAVLIPLIKAGNRWSHNSLHSPTLALLVNDSGGRAVGGLLLELDPLPLKAQEVELEQEMLFKLALLAIGSGIALVFVFDRVWRRQISGGKLMALVLLPTLLASAFLAWQSREQLAGSLQPAINAKAAAVAETLAKKIEYAVSIGIPPAKLVGASTYFAEVLAHNPDLARISLNLARGDGGQPAAPSTPASDPVSKVAIHAGGVVIGELSVMPDQAFVERALWAIAADVAVVLLVTILVFRELLASLVAQQGVAGAVSSAQSLRLPLFLFILSEELTRAFLPLFFSDFAAAGGVTHSTAVSLPIAVYMVFFALTTPYAGGWADRYGPRRVFALGALLAASGFVWMALTGHYWSLLAARALCATGYALGTMACQRQIIATTSGENRARGLALFVAAVSIAAICGTSIGGVLAERLGYRAVLVISAFAAVSGFVIFAVSQRSLAKSSAPQANFRLADLKPLLRNRRFMSLMLGAAIPAKISLAGFLFFLTPLGLQAADYSPAAIGRAIMLYYILLTLSNPLASYLSDRWQRHLSLVLGGMLLIGLGGLAGLASNILSPALSIWFGIIALGLGTGISAAPMQALAIELADAGSATSVLVALRTLERMGSVIGPLLAGVLLTWLPASGAMVVIGCCALLGTFLLFGLGRARPDGLPLRVGQT
jgi:MFS family permease